MANIAANIAAIKAKVGGPAVTYAATIPQRQALDVRTVYKVRPHISQSGLATVNRRGPIHAAPSPIPVVRRQGIGVSLQTNAVLIRNTRVY